jgi:hypothetical protein
LTPEQQERVSEQMKPFAGTKFDGAWVSIDPEVDLLFSSIEDALKKAGLVPVPFVGPGFIFGREGRSSVGMAGVWGLVVNVDPFKNPELVPAAVALLSALTREGVGAAYMPKVEFTSTNADTIHILVGVKH